MAEKKSNLINKIRLSSKIFTIATASLALITEKSTSANVAASPNASFNEIKSRSFSPRRLWKPKLTLKLSPNGSSRNLLAYHSSHSSHSSHASHSSHSSGGNGGGTIIGILAAGAIGYALYQSGKDKTKK